MLTLCSLSSVIHVALAVVISPSRQIRGWRKTGKLELNEGVNRGESRLTGKGTSIESIATYKGDSVSQYSSGDLRIY